VADYVDHYNKHRPQRSLWISGRHERAHPTRPGPTSK